MMSRGLLPHIFTLIRQLADGYFLRHCLSRPRESGDLPAFTYLSLPVRKYGALCCPDFPPLHKAEAAEQTNRPSAKVQQLFQCSIVPNS